MRLNQLLIGMLIISIIGLLFLMNQEKDNKSLTPIYYSSNYVTAWDVSYGEEDRQKMDVYLRGQQYVNRDKHNVRMIGDQPPTVGEKDQFGSQEKLDALTSALLENNIPYTLAKYPNSGHGFLTEDYNDMFRKIFIFIDKYRIINHKTTQ